MKRALCLGLLLLGCGKPSDKPACDSTLCSGCCDSVGQCQNGTRQTACGAAGNVCQICRSTEACDNGACVDATNAFNQCEGITCAAPLTCDRFDGLCKCGGVKCLTTETCDPSTKKCVANACGQASCAGCCENDVCQPGVLSARCGVNGQACQTCNAGQACQAGACGAAVPDAGICNAFNCGGCCRLGMCFPGFNDNACGNGGFECNQCTGSMKCLNSQCLFVPFDAGICQPGTCNGCCANGLAGPCISGFDDFACGSGGQTCSNCPNGTRCMFNVCTAIGVDAGTCNAANCAGCCLNGSCLNGLTDSACGFGAQACTTCMPGSTCDINLRQCVFGGSDAGGSFDGG